MDSLRKPINIAIPFVLTCPQSDVCIGFVALSHKAQMVASISFYIMKWLVLLFSRHMRVSFTQPALLLKGRNSELILECLDASFVIIGMVSVY